MGLPPSTLNYSLPTMTYPMVPGRAFTPPGAFWFLWTPSGYWTNAGRRENANGQDSTPAGTFEDGQKHFNF